MKTLDVITIGRSSVDLYGAQVGGRLEDMGSFQKYIGGSPTNIAAGTARLGMKSALIPGLAMSIWAGSSARNWCARAWMCEGWRPIRRV